MSIELLRRTGSRRFLIVLLTLTSWPGVAATRDDSARAAPLNAHMKRYGGGWECGRGYRRVDQSCVAIAVPENAHLDSSGDRWNCERGFRKAHRSCLAFRVPTNAHLGYSGTSWICDPGYRQRGEVCTPEKR